MEAALSLDGVQPMRTGARTMKGFVAASPQAMSDDGRRSALMRMALAFVRTLPPK